MKIISIEVENFRNFKDKYTFEFPTDGRMSIIYGTNGSGKTTFHQLIQWCIYNKVNFNKTASDIKYNLETARNAPIGSIIKVICRIIFEHPNDEGVIETFCIYRCVAYKKHSESMITENYTDFEITKKYYDGKSIDWHPVSGNSVEIINKILPQGLSQYFFFDGENMIADIKLTGTESAKSIQKALYSILDIDIYQHAIAHIGTKIGKAYSSGTVLGKLNSARAINITDSTLMSLKGDLNQAEKRLESCKKNNEIYTQGINKYRNEINELSEKIGSAKSAKKLNEERKRKLEDIKLYDVEIDKYKLAFGDTILNNYTNLLISSVAADAKNRIALKAEEEKELIFGVTKPLIEALLKEPVCLCGNQICEKEKKSLLDCLGKFPPKSYKFMYDLYKRESNRFLATYDKNLLFDYIKNILDKKERINKIQGDIIEIDESLKISTQLEELIEKRANAEKMLNYYSENQKSIHSEMKNSYKDYNYCVAKYNAALDKMEQNEDILEKMEIMESVLKYFQEKVESVKETYSKKLRDNIQEILLRTMNTERIVEITNDFVFNVKDEYGKEDKSEGQFAMVSFAYICGIFKLLLDEELLKYKQYPLVLDGPFSKLDVINRENIINELPAYAPQVILFSKDDLSDVLTGDEEIWTLFPNAKKNITEIKKGYFPEVFEQ